VWLEERVREDGHTHQDALLHREVDKVLEGSKGLLERLPRQAEEDAGHLGGDVGVAWLAGEEGPFAEEIPGTHDLIDVLGIPPPDVVDLHPPLLEDVEYLPHIPLVDDAVPLLKADGREGVGDLDEHRLFEIREEVDLPQHVQRVLLLTRVVVREHVAEGALVDLPESAVGVGDAGRGAGAVVQERELPEGRPPGARPHVISVDGEGDVAVLDHVEIIPDLPLVDDDRAGGDAVGLHGVDEESPFLPREGGEDEIVREGLVDELHRRARLGVAGYGEVLGHVERLREDILAALGLGLAVDVDRPLPRFDVNLWALLLD